MAKTAKRRYIFAVDPGPVQSAFVVYDPAANAVKTHGILDNEDLAGIHPSNGCLCVIEMIASYGMPVGADIFETCVWIGRFIESWKHRIPELPAPVRITRGTVKMCLCQSMRAKDGNIRQALIDRFPATGGGKIPQIGTKGQPGPLYGVSKDVWAALGVAVTYAEQAHSTLKETGDGADN